MKAITVKNGTSSNLHDSIKVSIVFKICKLKVTHKRRWYVLACILLVVFVIILALTPIENIFITFPSAEAAFEYSNNMRNSTPLVVEGQDSAFVIAKKTDVQDVYSFVRKGNMDGNCVGYLMQKLCSERLITGSWCVYRYKNTTDYYISVSNINGDKSIVQDNYNSKFYVFSDEDSYTYYYAYVSNLCQDYILTVNNKEISIMK